MLMSNILHTPPLNVSVFYSLNSTVHNYKITLYVLAQEVPLYLFCNDNLPFLMLQMKRLLKRGYPITTYVIQMS